jgi:hypothetical protein
MFTLNPSELKPFDAILEYINLDINLGISLEKQVEILQEDLIQIKISSTDMLLDVGWYPSEDINGAFKIMLIKQHDWDKPIRVQTTKNINELKKIIFNMLEGVK